MARRAQTPDHEVIVIGAGPAGIAAGVKLRQAGIEDFAVLERAGSVDGTWRDNTYPGICVDIPSVGYQFSFARNPDRSRVFASGAEVRDYHVDVASRFGLEPHLRFHTDVVREVWDEGARCWRLATADGREISARFVISAIGAFIKPKEDPGIPGVGDFAGKIQRPCRWDHDYDHRGKRVAIVGTGASSVQITPSIAPEVAHREVYQRTPVWCAPKPNPAMPAPLRRAFALPGVLPAIHAAALGVVELALRAIVYTPTPVAKPALAGVDAGARVAYRGYLRLVVDDARTRKALMPRYGVIVKRPTASNTYLRAFNRDNVDLITTRIERITKKGIRTDDGVEHELDMIVLATGYHLFSDPESYVPGTIVGRDGFDLGEFYATHHLQAYESVAVPGCRIAGWPSARTRGPAPAGTTWSSTPPNTRCGRSARRAGARRASSRCARRCTTPTTQRSSRGRGTSSTTSTSATGTRPPTTATPRATAPTSARRRSSRGARAAGASPSTTIASRCRRASARRGGPRLPRDARDQRDA